jgi:hypothetical protein
MICVLSIDIEEFRGIRHLHIDLKGENFGICGPNGTGKSGIVDAIEFVLTGNVTRLSGAGSGDISLKEHAPHVDSRKKPQSSTVSMTVYSWKLKKEFSIKRSVSNAANPIITPDEPQIRQLVEELAKHPEFALSRREIVKYIITPAGQRSKDVQTLLRLDQIGEVRASLQSVANRRKREATTAELEDSRALSAFLSHLGIATLCKADLLKAVNERRALLQVELLTDFTPETSLKAGITAADKKDGGAPSLSRDASNKALGAFDDACGLLSKDEISKRRKAADECLDQLKKDPETLRSFRQQVLVEQGIELLGEDACPLCDTAWDMKALKKHLEEKQKAASGVKKLLEKLEGEINPIVQAYNDVVNGAQALAAIAQAAKPAIDLDAVRAFTNLLKNRKATLTRVYKDPSAIDDAKEALSDGHWATPTAADGVIKSLRDFVSSLPEPSKEEAAREFLILAQEKYERRRETAARRKHAAAESSLASKVSELYGASSTAVLEGIYDSVERDFTDYYRIINEDDEKMFIGELSTPSPAKLALNVDFYGRGKFPPGAYHSEGHQDGMGLCLYLALMKHTLGEGFTFAVLDDVLMSVDSGHRKAVCALLTSKFSRTQFILTTHDPVWLEYMRTEKLLDRHLSFSGWSVDSGPVVWTEGNVWTQIDELLAKNDVPGAAAKLRRYMEYIGTVLSSNLRATVEYQSNGQYEFGDLVPAAFRAFKDQLSLAKKSAVKWGHNAKAIEAQQTEINDKIAKTNAEQWAINKAVHFNAWATMQAKEFAVVAAAFKDVLTAMQCTQPKCGQFLRVSPRKGTEEIMSCGCGAVSYNLKLK